jgi:hypothetical protein
MVATVEATAITGTTTDMATVMVMVIMGMVITAIAIISTFITAAGNGAPTARSTSATAIIDSRRRKAARPGREARASFSMMTTVIVCLGGNQSRCKRIGLPGRQVFRSATSLNAQVLERICRGFTFRCASNGTGKRAAEFRGGKLDV